MASPQPDIALDLRPDHPPPDRPRPERLRWETAVAVGTLVVGAGVGWGAIDIPSEAGYGGVGANFLPWVVAAALMLFGALMLFEARTGGFRQMEQPLGSERPDWMAFVWVSVGLLLNWVLIEHIGFLLSCTLTYLLAVQGLRRAYGQRHDTWVRDLLSGLALSAPVYWFFTQFLAISLPGLTRTGWI